MSDILIRGLKKSKIQKLKELAKRNQFSSLNAYLTFKLEQLAEEQEILEYQAKHLEVSQKNMDVIEQNTVVLTELLRLLGGE